MAGRIKLLEFPQIKREKHLNQQLDEWLDLFYKYGDDMGAAAVQVLFMRILPDGLRAEIFRRRELKDLELMGLIEWVRTQTIWNRSEELAAQLMQPEKAIAALSAGGGGGGGDDRRRGPGARRLPGRRPQAPPGPRPRGPPREQNPLIREFRGCFHCGEEGHARTPNEARGLKGCPTFEALLREHKGLPKNYKGKLE